MRLLELFCGTKSVGKAVGHRFSEVISLDLDPKASPTIVADILTWDYRVFPVGHFHTIWASPPCTEYSKLNEWKPSKVPNLSLADSIVQRTLEIITYFNPHRWFVENPQSGTLKSRVFMDGIPFIDCDYCRFSDWGYRKRTRFWGNIIADNILCKGAGLCENMVEGKHSIRIGLPKQGGPTTLSERHRIPPALILHLFDLPHL